MQHHRINKFLSHFDQRVKTTTIEVCKAISQSEAHLYILMARKAACFFECLHELGLVQFNGSVASDRILEMDCSWLKDKKVIIVDDAVISGTTVYETIQKLRNYGVREIEVFVLCINKKWCRLDMLSNEAGIPYIRNPFLRLEDEECIKMCTDIVYALAKYIRPYSVDFPLYKNFILTNDQLRKLVSTSEWVINDISTKNQTQDGLIVLTCTPTVLINESLDQKLGIDFSRVAMPKIRLYLVPHEKAYRLCILPVVVLKPIYEDEIIEIFHHFAEHKSDSFRKHFSSTISKIHFIQYVTAGVLAQIWASPMDDIFGPAQSLRPDGFNNSLLFNPHVAPLVYNSVLYHFGTDEKDTIFRQIKVLKKEVEEWFEPTDKRIDNLIGCQAALTQPFIDLYYNEEEKSRCLVLEHGKAVYQKQEFIEIVDRLKRGYSVTNLLNTIRGVELEDSKGLPFPFDHMQFLSLFLDKSIDLGIVVPIVAQKAVNGRRYFYRAYRHGEDVSFGEVEFLLCTYLLDRFVQSARSEGTVPHLIAEKLIVLFIKIGISKELFVQFISNLPSVNAMQNEGIVSIRSYVLGQVATISTYDRFQNEKIPVYIDDEGHSNWITQKLLDRHFLVMEEGQRDYYRVDIVDYGRLDQKKRDQTLMIADLFGMLMHKDVGKLKAPDLVTLTSCIEAHDIAGSLAAELVIFNNRWPDYGAYFLNNRTKPNRYFLVATNIRKVFNIIMTAIDSGFKKYEDYKAKRGIQLVREISSFLETQRAMDAAMWRSFWSPNLSGTTTDSSLGYLVDALGIWLARTNLLIRILDYALRRISIFDDLIHDVNRKFLLSLLSATAIQRAEKKGDKGYIEELSLLNEAEMRDLEERINYFKEQVRKYEPNASFRFTVFHPLTTNFEKLSREQMRTVLTEAFDNLRDQFYYSKLFIEDVDAQVTPYGKPAFRIDFTQALYLDVRSWDDTRKIKQMSRLTTRIRVLIKEQQPLKTGKSLRIDFRVLDAMRVNKLPGIFVLWGGEDCDKFGILLSIKIYHVYSKIISGYAVIFNDLQREYAPMHTGLESVSIWYRYFKEFTSSFITQFNHNRLVPPLTLITEKNRTSLRIRQANKVLVESETHIYKANKIDRLFTETPFPHEVEAISFTRQKKGEPYKLVKKQKNKLVESELFSQETNYDIGLITIRETETRVVVEGINALKEGIKAPSKKRYNAGTLPGANGVVHRVIHSQMLDMGNINATNMYQLMVQDFNPKLIILIGTAGGYSDKVSLCDVILSKRIVYYELGKEKNGIMNREIFLYHINRHFEDHFINPYFVKHGGDEINMKASSGSIGEAFVVRKGTIGAGEKILEDPESDIRAWLRVVDRKTGAFEMESAGAFAAQESNELFYGKRNFGALTIRAIADYGDPNKTTPDVEKYRIPALENAMAFTRDFIGGLPDLQQAFKELYPNL